MERITLSSPDEIKQFQEYIMNFPDSIVKCVEQGSSKLYTLNTNQQISIPIASNKYDKLIFGKNDTENIVNITFKGNKIYIYYSNGKFDIIDYNPWFLSHVSGKVSSPLKGKQYFKYISHYPIDEYRAIYTQYKYAKDLWFPRSLEEGYMMLNGLTYFKGMRLNQISILSFDIENLDEKNYPAEDLVVIISNTFRDNKGNITKRLFDIKDYMSSSHMVKDWCSWVRQMNPDVITGHNIFSHDLKILNLVTSLELGRDGSILKFDENVSKFRKDSQQQYEYYNARIHGREIVDTFFLSIRYDIGRKFPSYGLKSIEKHLNLQPKSRIEWDFQLNPVEKTLQDEALWVDFLKYAEADSDSPLKMIDIMLSSIFYFNQSVPKTLQQMCQEATGSQLDSMMIRSYLQDGYSQPKTSSKVPFEGAISLGIPGIYKNVKKIDVASLYPSIMLQYDIYDKEKDPNRHILKILSYFRDERLKNKALAKTTNDQYYDDLQNSQKIAINSTYGFLGAGYLLYNFPAGAASVTRSGREVITKTTEFVTGYTLKRGIKKIVHEGEDNEVIQYEWVLGDKVCEGKGYTLVNGDTDAISYTNGLPFTKEEYMSEIAEINDTLPSYIKFEDDGAYEKLIVSRAKNYVMLPLDPKKKKKNLDTLGTEYSLKGSSIMDQKKEPALREMLQALIECLIYEKTNDDLLAIYHKYIIESQNITDVKRWATKKTITKAVLNPERSTEQKILNAVANTKIQEGDKVFLIQCIDGEKQKKEKGELVFLKDGSAKMIKNDIYVLTEKWYPGYEDKEHYLQRVYDTLSILENVIDVSQFPKYTLKNNKQKLKELLNKMRFYE